MSITLTFLGFALTFSVSLRRLPDLEPDDRPTMEAAAGGQFELASPQPLWSGDEFGFRTPGGPDGG